jgi:hypothetical protein
VLVFAHSVREAKKLAAPVLLCLVDARFTEVRVQLIRRHADWFMALAQDSAPHVIYNPPSCDRCEQWGSPIIDRLCEDCRNVMQEES